jgi:hypothetical protein
MRGSVQWAWSAVLLGLSSGCGGESSAHRAVRESAGTGGTADAGSPAGGSTFDGRGGNAAGGAPAAGSPSAGTTGGDSSSAGTAAGESSSAGSATNGGTSGGTVPQGGMSGRGGGAGVESEPNAGAAGDASSGVRIIRGEPGEEFWDLTIRGEGLDEYEGLAVLVRMGWPDRPPERLAWGEASIAQGAFELLFPAVWESNLYKTKLVLIDVNGDGACDLSMDQLFGDSRAVQAAELVVNGGATAGRYDMGEMPDEFYCGWFNIEWPLE